MLSTTFHIGARPYMRNHLAGYVQTLIKLIAFKFLVTKRLIVRQFDPFSQVFGYKMQFYKPLWVGSKEDSKSKAINPFCPSLKKSLGNLYLKVCDSHSIFCGCPYDFFKIQFYPLLQHFWGTQFKIFFCFNLKCWDPLRTK